MTKFPRKPTAAPPPPRRAKTKLPPPSKRRASTRAEEEAAKEPEPAKEPEKPPGRARAASELEIEIEMDVESSVVDAAGEIGEPEAGSEAGSRIDGVAPRAISVGDDQLVAVEELAEVPALAIAVFEEPAALSTVQSAIATAGHATAIGETGPDGLERVRRVLADDVDVLLVGLPGGEPLIDAALALAPGRPVVIAAVTGGAVEGVRRAAAAGADLAVVRPHDAERLAPVLLAAARLADERRRATTARGTEQLLRARLDALAESDTGSLQPFELFQRALELELKRARRYGYALSVALFAVEIPPPAPPPGVRGILRARAGNALIHAIRDIDIATSLPMDLTRAFDSVPATDERFLVLLPYTDLGGAALLARRVIAAVAEGAPVVAAGRAFAPRFVGAVAGAAPGQPLSFSRLMKDATRALEQARRDGAELAVPMPPPPGAA